MRKGVLLFLFGVASALLLAAKPFEGPYTAEGTVFYLVHKGGPLTIEVILRKSQPSYDRGTPLLRTTPCSLLTVAGPDERILEKKYWRLEEPTGEQRYVFTYPQAAPGIWQLRNSFAANTGMSIQFQTTPAVKHGVLFSRCRILPDDMANIRNSFFLVPPPLNNLHLPYPSTKGPQKRVQRLHIASRSPQTCCFDSQGRKIAQCDVYEISCAMSDIHGNSHITLPFGSREETVYTDGPKVTLQNSARGFRQTLEQDSKAVLDMVPGDIYHLSLQNCARGYLAVDGFPVIFCPDEETARAINGSIVTTADGRAFPHRFQKEICEWMRSIKKSDLELPAYSMLPYKQQWLSDKRSGNLLELFAYAPHLLKSQDIDPQSPTFGESPLVLRDLALLYALKRPYNPYYGNRQLMNRLFLYYFRKWLHLAENGVFQDDPSHGAYCGGLEWTGWEGMVFYADYVTLALAAPLADPKLQSLLAEALSLPVHRLWNQRLTCENQSLHWPLKLLALHQATGDPLYLRLEHDILKDLGDPGLSESMKTGYLMEAYGLDGTYPGISACMLAYGARLFKDNAPLPVLRRFYDLMNHTIVREPDGTLVAANGFGHRTLGTWLSRQYDGGTSYWDDILPEAAATTRRARTFTPITEKLFDTYAHAQIPEDFAKWCQGPGKEMTVYQMDAWVPLWFQSVLPIGDVIQNAKLPAESSECFLRNFNNELVAVRTPAFYTLLYTGNPSWRYHYWRTFDTPFPAASRERNGELYSAGASSTWMPTQGIQIFWTPGFGAFLLAHNWNMYTQNLVRADQNGKTVDFATCYTSQADIKGNVIRQACQTKFLGLAIQRTMETLSDGLKVTLQVNAPEKLAPVELVEQLPYLLKKDLIFTCFSGEKRRDFPGAGITSLQVIRSNGSAVTIRFDRPVTIRQGYRSGAALNPPSMKSGLLEIVFAPAFDGTAPATLSYTITAGTAPNTNAQASHPAPNK